VTVCAHEVHEKQLRCCEGMYFEVMPLSDPISVHVGGRGADCLLWVAAVEKRVTCLLRKSGCLADVQCSSTRPLSTRNDRLRNKVPVTADSG